jgi:hypothetical protein
MRVEADTARVRGDGGGRDAPAWASWSAALLALAIVLLVAATGGLAGAAASMRLQHGAEHTCAAAGPGGGVAQPGEGVVESGEGVFGF